MFPWYSVTAKKAPILQREVWGDSVYCLIFPVNKKLQKFIFEYWVFLQKSYLNMLCFEKIHICIPKIQYLHTLTSKSAYQVNFQTCFDFF